MRIGILGGGITGVALQNRLRHESLVLEASEKPGGLCRTYFKDGFGYDIGGHILFSKHQHVNEFVDELLTDNLNRCKRANQILFGGKYVKYPFENDLASLDPEDTYDCLLGYLRNPFSGEVTNLEEWSYSTFGEGISDKYFLPYNAKIWNIAPSELGLDFVERIPKPPMEDVVRSALGIETEGYLHQLYFRYPTRGGAEAMVHALIDDDSEIVCNSAVTSIRRHGEHWHVSSGGEEHEFDHVVVSFPIHDAIKCFENVPEEVQNAIDDLRYNSMRVVLVAVDNESLMDKSAVYIPDPSVVMHRVCYMGFFSQELVRPGTSSLIAEITTNPGDGVHELTDEELTARVIADAERIGILKADDVIVTDVHRVPYAYPVYTLSYRRNIAIVRRYFEELGVDLCGRFAEFEYINSDACLNRAMKLADRLNGQNGAAAA
ncbi:MAG: FAD-dependent oxidoreductase [Actinobacteria bacterium]|nr:FAD-dependent oxidoreductase [Actinomycetota bacterium]